MMELVLLGYPVAHSLSPKFQNAALRKLGLPLLYTARAVDHEGLAAAVAEIRRGELAGANVTLPHKEAALRLVDRVSEEARLVGAVNTLVRRGDEVVGFNTDVAGFRAYLPVSTVYRNVLVAGAGGAARGVVYGLLGRAEVVHVLNRSRARAEALVESFLGPAEAKGTALVYGELGEIEQRGPFDLVVQATSLGVKALTCSPYWAHFEWKELAPDALYVDLVYAPPGRQTPFVEHLQTLGLVGQGGLKMLVEQGAASFELWTGEAAPRDVMYEALKA